MDDLAQFYKIYNINANISSVKITENTGTVGGDNWGEGTLDAEYITAFAPGVTTLVVNSNTSMSTEEGLGFGYAFLDELLALAQVPNMQLPYVLSLSLGSVSWSSCNMMSLFWRPKNNLLTKTVSIIFKPKDKFVCMIV